VTVTQRRNALTATHICSHRHGLVAFVLALVLTATVACASPQETQPMTATDDLAEFSWRFYRQLGQGEDNLVFSPFSISSVFAMLSAGASGETLAELRRAFAFSGHDEAWHASQGELLDALAALNREGDDYQNALTLRVVNDLWLQQGFEVGAAFLATLAQHYGSAPQALDFAAEPEAARQHINAKVAADTADLIRDLLPQGSVTDSARLVLTNALYFKGGWASPFRESATEPGPFHAIDGSAHEMPMMRITARFAYVEVDGWQALSLPYDGGDLEMLVMMPADGQFRRLAATLDTAQVDSLLEAQRSTRVRLSFPGFSMRTTVPLVAELERLGVHQVFTDAAQLHGIADNLYVSAAMHEAVVEVDEQGTEAAAATAAVISLTSMPMEEPEPLVVRIDRPFVFVIRDRRSGAPLFIGQMLKP
jgi:serpin B